MPHGVVVPREESRRCIDVTCVAAVYAAVDRHPGIIAF